MDIHGAFKISNRDAKILDGWIRSTSLA